MPHKIKFSSPFKEFISEPKPSKKVIPEAFKKMLSFAEKDISKPTVKKCMPFLDTLTTGYIISTPVDYLLVKNPETSEYEFKLPPNLPPFFEENFRVEKHQLYQMEDSLRYDKRTVDQIFKFINPWKIKTPPGYSCLFTQPLNKNCPFKIIDGIVDTDTFDLTINFPFYWTGESQQQVLLKRDTPMVQIIPFKREQWEMTVEEDTPDLRVNLKMFSDFWDNYKNKIWHKKDYS